VDIDLSLISLERSDCYPSIETNYGSSFTCSYRPDLSVSLAVHGWDVSETGNVFGDWRGENGHCWLHGKPATLYAKFSCLMPTTVYCLQSWEGV